ncbi:hypothetical protein GGQ99_005130 [Aminobacter niigataensis]|uniref:Uncharacterized protein n=1 Tax=Aminobacter niigataensis TaxID=83265 RepID=A0ABR6LBF6_9HYPH|nr:hypothetical protein [Aminobacter niigataensis]MBB4653340.1 hypothetical protein [Aminobacter niigataensis]
MKHSVPDEGIAIIATAQRGYYGEISRIELAGGTILSAAEIVRKFSAALPDTFASFDRKMRGDSLNLDLYGYDPEQDVAVIQIRHFFKRYAKGFANVHKDYVLAGRNEETGQFFRHPVSAHAVHAAIRKDGVNPVAVIRAAQRWMWDVTDKQLATGIRQGDILIVPAKGRPANGETIEADIVLVGGTHEVHASAFCRDKKGVVYAHGPTVRHTKAQHLTTYGDGDFWHSIRVGREAATWEWGKRLGD